MSLNTATAREIIVKSAPISAIFLVAFCFYLLAGEVAMTDPDVPWHLAAGKEIIQTMSIPRVNTWSFSAPDYRWYNLSWLWDALISLIVSWFGFNALAAFCAIIPAATLAMIAGNLKSRVHPHVLPPVLITIGLVYMHQVFARPQTATLPLLFLFYVMAGKLRKPCFKQVGVLAAITLLWANLHGSFVLAFVVLAANAAEAYSGRDWLRVRAICAAFLASALAALINPFGIYIVPAVLSSLSSVIGPYLLEWHSYKFGPYAGTDVLIFLLLMCSNYKNPAVPLAERILTFFFLIASLTSIRHFPVLATVSAYFLASNLEALVPANIKRTEIPDLTFPRSLVLLLLAVIIPVGTVVLGTEKITGRDAVYGKNNPYIGAVEFIKHNYPESRFFNEYTIGGHMAYAGLKVFADGRADTAYPEEVLFASIDIAIKGDKAEFLKLKEKYRFDGIVARKDLIPRAVTQELWKKVYNDEYYEIYMNPKAVTP